MIVTPADWIESFGKILSEPGCKVQGKLTDSTSAFDELGDVLEKYIGSEKSVWWVGNGGSSAICSHLSQDLLNKLDIRSFLLTDHSMLTCMANDFGYSQVYLQPLKKLAKADDLLIAISSSGNSQNIIQCAEFAKNKGMKLVTLSGFNPDNTLFSVMADVSFHVASELYGIVEVAHEALLHAVIETIFLKRSEA